MLYVGGWKVRKMGVIKVLLRYLCDEKRYLCDEKRYLCDNKNDIYVMKNDTNLPYIVIVYYF